MVFRDVAAFVVLGSLTVGCGSGKAASPSDKLPPDHTTFNVEWGDNTEVISEADGKAHLTGAAPTADTLTYTFDHGATAIAALKPGQIAVLSGIAYRKVDSVTDTGTGYQLVTERTTLPAAMKNGTIDWSHAVNFGSLSSAPQATAFGEPLGRVSQALGGPVTYNGEIDGYTISVTLTPGTDRLDISSEISLEVAGEKRFAIEGTGYIESFASQGRAVVTDGQLVDFQAGQTQVRGELEAKAAAFNTGTDDNLLDIPIGIDIPIDVGPVPFILTIKAEINVHLILSISDSSAQADVTFHFSSDQGIALAGTSLQSTGALRSGTLEGFLGGSADSAAAGMAACVEFPRFELATLGEFASVGFTQNNCAQTDFTFDPACNEVYGTMTGIALADLGFFGVTLASGQVTLYSRTDGHHSGQCQ
jgi:hypothetical protein